MAEYRRDPYAVSHAAPQGGWYVIPLRRHDGALEENILFLGDVAGRLWELLEAPHTPEALVAALVEEYEVDGPVAQGDVEQFLTRLTELQAVFTEDLAG